MADLMRWDPIGDINRLFTPFITSKEFPFLRDFNTPRVDVSQTDTEVKVVADLPGIMSKNDIDVSVFDNSLEIKGEIKRETDNKRNENQYISERFYGKFDRVISLPSEVKPDEAKAKYENGILTITMPKKNPTINKHKIDIQ